MSRMMATALAMATVLTILACEEGGDNGLSVDATGAVAGVAWLDRNGNGQLDGTDGPVRDVQVELIPGSGESGGTVAYSAVANTRGEFVIDDVLVGDYRVAVDEATVGDTLRVLRIDSAHVTVAAGDTTVVTVGLTYPSVPTDTVRVQPTETRLFVEGLVLTRWGAFGEESLHVRDSTGAIRAVRVTPTGVVPGDSVRLQGTTTIQGGQPVLKDGLVFRLRTGVESPPGVEVTSAEAASAADGELDADLVRLDSVVVRDTSRTAAGEFVLTVDDGSGRADVVLDLNIQFNLPFETEIIGTILEVSGVLVPSSPGGDWVVKPRSSADVEVGPLSWPTMTVVEAKAAPTETRLIVSGIALNEWRTFADSTLHVRDATGAIRSVRVPATTTATNIRIGDSIRVVGTTAVLRSQPVLTQVAAKILQQGLAPPEPSSVGTLTAATANGGALDAELVRVEGTVQDTARTSLSELILRVDDGSGPLDVVLDRDVQFFLSFPRDGSGQLQVIGTPMDVTGLLVPASGTTGRWILKPRQNGDVVIP